MPNLQIGLTGLNVAQRAIDLIATNIANASTDGYHRQDIVAQPVSLNAFGNVPIGGVEIGAIRRGIDTFLEREINRQVSSLTHAQEQLGLLETVESGFGNVGAEGLGVAIGHFFDSLTELTADPASLPLRGQAVWAADSLAGQLRSLAQFLQNLSDQIDRVVEEHVNQINSLTEEIAQLTMEMAAITIQGGSANLLADRQGQAVRELAELAEVTMSEDVNRPEALYLSVWGKPVVVTGHSIDLESGKDSDGNLGIARAGYAVYDTTLSGGRVGALVTLKNEVIPDIMDQLNSLAGEIASQVNRVHVQGIGATGSFASLSGVPIPDGVLQDWADGVSSGDFYVRVIDTTTGDVTRHEITVDVSTDTPADVAAALDALTGLSASFANSVLTVLADTDYEFDFLPAVLSEPYTSTISGTADPTIAGRYTGDDNETFTCTIVGTGQVGITDGLVMEVRDSGANLLQRVDVGLGYAASDPLSIGSGLTVAWTTGSLNDGDEFTIQALADSDPTGFLATAGMNTLFTGDSALNLQVRQEYLDEPRRLATARGADGADATNVSRMAGIGQENLANLSGMTAQAYFGLVVTEVGQAATVYRARVEALVNVLQQLNVRRDEISSVDLNQEAARLVIFERMFEAMSRVILTQSRALQALLELV